MLSRRIRGGSILDRRQRRQRAKQAGDAPLGVLAVAKPFATSQEMDEASKGFVMDAVEVEFVELPTNDN